MSCIEDTAETMAALAAIQALEYWATGHARSFLSDEQARALLARPDIQELLPTYIAPKYRHNWPGLMRLCAGSEVVS